MKLKAFGIFCLSFFMTTAMSSCDSDEITDQPGEVSGSEYYLPVKCRQSLL